MTSCRDRKGVLGGLCLYDQLQIGRGFWGDCACMTSCRDRKGVLGGIGRGFWGDCACMTSCRDRKGVLGGLCLCDQWQR